MHVRFLHFFSKSKAKNSLGNLARIYNCWVIILINWGKMNCPKKYSIFEKSSFRRPGGSFYMNSATLH
jgi:hypothetical protein